MDEIRELKPVQVATPAGVMVEAILDREWWDHAKAAHRHHQYDSGCCVCRGDVLPIVEEALRALDFAGFSVIADEDLRTAFAHWRRPVTNQLGGQDAYDRLHAALPPQETADVDLG